MIFNTQVLIIPFNEYVSNIFKRRKINYSRFRGFRELCVLADTKKNRATVLAVDPAILIAVTDKGTTMMYKKYSQPVMLGPFVQVDKPLINEFFININEKFFVIQRNE